MSSDLDREEAEVDGTSSRYILLKEGFESKDYIESYETQYGWTDAVRYFGNKYGLRGNMMLMVVSDNDDWKKYVKGEREGVTAYE